MNASIQVVTMWAMAGSGALLGALFDVYRVLSGQFRPPRWLVPLLDLVYWLAATALVFYMLLNSNDGQVRFYVFLGLVVGGWLYFRLASRWMVQLVLLVIRIVRFIGRVIRRFIELFLIKPIVLLYRLVIILLGFLWTLAVFLYKVVLQLLYPFRLLGRAVIQPIRSRWKTPLWWSRFATSCAALGRAVARLFGRGND